MVHHHLFGDDVDSPEHLSALGQLLDQTTPDPRALFEHGLALLAQQLHLDCVVVSRTCDAGLEPTWWHCPDAELMERLSASRDHDLCQLIQAHPHRTLVVQDTADRPEWRALRTSRDAGIRTCIGGLLWQDGRPGGVLLGLGREPHRFERHELALFAAVANLFARTIEVEALKYELRVTRDALDLATAIVEDSAFESPSSGLPSASYLEVWLKANLYLARRRDERMALVLWHLEPRGEVLQALRRLAETLRGEDLMVDLGHGEFLLLMPHTDRAGAVRPLERLRGLTGPIPMGATLWDPRREADRDDLTLQLTRTRLLRALGESRRGSGVRGADVYWELEAVEEGDPEILPV